MRRQLSMNRTSDRAKECLAGRERILIDVRCLPRTFIQGNEHNHIIDFLTKPLSSRDGDILSD